MEISEKEFAVIREISNNHKPAQRDIAKKAGISLGMTNIIIKRLVEKGFIKMQEAPPRTVIYTLTPKGLAEKTKKSYQFALKTIDIIRHVKNHIQDIILKEYDQGARSFVISGSGELAAFTEIVLRDLNFNDVVYSKEHIQTEGGSFCCYLVFVRGGCQTRLDLIGELSKRGFYY